jgi:hypothetical protein
VSGCLLGIGELFDTPVDFAHTAYIGSICPYENLLPHVDKLKKFEPCATQQATLPATGRGKHD